MKIELRNIDMVLGFMNTINASREEDLKDGLTHVHEEKKLETLLETINNMFAYYLIGVDEWNYLHEIIIEEIKKRDSEVK